TAAMAIGIGGGILWTPLLILVYQLTPADAISTSLFIQVAGLGSGTLAYSRAGRVNMKLSGIFFLVALPGIIIGSFITINLPQQAVQMALGIMAMTLAILFVTSNQEAGLESNGDISNAQIRSVTPIPFVFGFVMGFLSLGISEWLIPALRTKLRMGMQQAIGTAIAMMFMLAMLASLVHFYLSDTVHVKIIVLGAIGTLIGGQIGPRISKRINDKLLQQSFIYLMTLIGIHLIFQAI
ncbi:MAG: sulfite exporter TauE/SafE family protein, partial [Aestuariibacter sp.]|nr:sulfite exporter TauE/SafE family protein [Aestuariibacter sp.]